MFVAQGRIRPKRLANTSPRISAQSVPPGTPGLLRRFGRFGRTLVDTRSQLVLRDRAPDHRRDMPLALLKREDRQGIGRREVVVRRVAARGTISGMVPQLWLARRRRGGG